MKTKDFFNKMPCIVNMSSFSGTDEEKLLETDEIVRIERRKEMLPYYEVYYLHRIYNDDRIYKCSLRLKHLPDWLRCWMEKRDPKETQLSQYWDN